MCTVLERLRVGAVRRERRHETAGGGRILCASPPPKLHRALVICSMSPFPWPIALVLTSVPLHIESACSVHSSVSFFNGESLNGRKHVYLSEHPQCQCRA